MERATPYVYTSAARVFELLSAVERGISLHRAIASRLERQQANAQPMSPETHALISPLVADGFLLPVPFQSDLSKALEVLGEEEQLTQQLKANSARRKTLELQLRNTQQELNKGGLFRGRAKQELSLKASKLEAQYAQLAEEAKLLQDRLGLVEYLLKKAAQESVAQPELSEARWLEADQLALALTTPGRFLLTTLSALPPQHLSASLARALTTPVVAS